MHTIETIREFNTRNFHITVNAVEDNDLDLSFDDTGEVLRDLENGTLCAFGVVVTVYAKGQKIGNDSLWGCIYKTPRDFMDHLGIKALSRKDGKNYGSYFSDMIHTAISEARKTIGTLRALPIHN